MKAFFSCDRSVERQFLNEEDACVGSCEVQSRTLLGLTPGLLPA
jgi:hypothetical protein